MKEEYFETNRSLWDHWTQLNLKSAMYDLESWKAGRNSVDAIPLNALQGLIEGRRLLHLMCHFGQDTLSFARMGAQVTGVDMSGEAVRTARKLADELELSDRADFVECNLYDLPGKLDGTFDLVFTSYGVLTWLPDLQKWASIINQFLRPGGTFFMAEFHPFLYAFDFESRKPDYEYFGTDIPQHESEAGNYALRENTQKKDYYFWIHSLSQVIRPLLDRGLQLRDFNEYDYSPYNCFPNMTERAPGQFVFQADGKIRRLPHVFSLKMEK